MPATETNWPGLRMRKCCLRPGKSELSPAFVAELRSSLPTLEWLPPASSALSAVARGVPRAVARCVRSGLGRPRPALVVVPCA
jgi:hypothetical protein